MLEKIKEKFGVTLSAEKSAEKSAAMVEALAQRSTKCDETVAAASQNERSALLSLEDGTGSPDDVRAAKRVLAGAIAARNDAATLYLAALSRHELIDAKRRKEEEISAAHQRGAEINRLVDTCNDHADYLGTIGLEFANRYRTMHVDLESLCELAGKKRVEDLQQQLLFPAPLGARMSYFLNANGATFCKPHPDASVTQDITKTIKEGVAAVRSRAGLGA